MSRALTILLLLTWSHRAHGESPKVVDERLQLTLFAEQPDLVTPIGLSVDPRGRVFVVESHTHFPPANYSGPKSDRTTRASAFRAGLPANRLLWAGIAVEIALLLAIVYLPPLQRVFGTGGIPPEGWLFVLPWAPALLLADEARKAILRRRDKTSSTGGAP